MNPELHPEHEIATKKEVSTIEEMVIENQKLLAENNKLLKKINRSNTWAFWLRILWIAILLGLPVVVYYYIIAPYYESLETAFQFFGVQLPNIPGWNEAQ
jgi:hypothetical protein